MSDLTHFRGAQCRKCGQLTMYQLGDAHQAIIPLYNPTGDLTAAPSVVCKVKVCANCAYVEMYSDYLLKSMEAQEEQSTFHGEGGAAAAQQFGTITKLDESTYLVSIFVDYKTADGREAHDFTVPVPAQKFRTLRAFNLTTTDQMLMRSLLDGSYMEAWKKLVKKDPIPFAAGVRELLKNYSAENNLDKVFG